MAIRSDDRSVVRDNPRLRDPRLTTVTSPVPVDILVDDPHQQGWIRANGKLPDEPALHQALLAYLSDMSLLDTSSMPHGVSYFDSGMQIASLDHAMWFHRPFRTDDWLLYETDSPSTSNARGFNRGTLYARDGTLVASVVQEGLIRQAPANRVKA